MPRSRPLSPAVSLIRPMLTLSRCMAQEYLKALGVDWQTDLSNESEEFTRNRIRHDLLPMLEREFNPQASTAILRLGHLAGEAQEMIDEVIARALEECNWKKRGETGRCIGEYVWLVHRERHQPLAVVRVVTGW